MITFAKQVRDAKRQAIETALCAARGNRTVAAEALGVRRTYLHRLMRQFSIRIPSRPEARRTRRHAERGWCPQCRRLLSVRLDGLVHEHSTGGVPCVGGFARAVLA